MNVDKLPQILQSWHLVGLVIFVLKTEAVFPALDGGYPGGNTAEGQSALLSLRSGQFNTAVGYLSLPNATTTTFNTAIGARAPCQYSK